MAWTTYPSPLGPLILIGGTSGLRHVYFPGRAPSLTPSDRNPSTLAETVGQLDEYFAGERQAFELQLDLAGSSFRHRVWRALQQVPYGHTITYGDLLVSLASPSPAASSLVEASYRAPRRSRGRSRRHQRRSSCHATA